jgi:hypothetical protein
MLVVGPTGMYLLLLRQSQEESQTLHLLGYPQQLAEGLLEISSWAPSDKTSTFAFFSADRLIRGSIALVEKGKESWVVLEISGHSAKPPFSVDLRREEAKKLGQTLQNYWTH